MINGNLVGFGMFAVAAVLIAIGSYVLKLPDAPVMVAAGVLLIVVDMALRLTKMKNTGWIWGNKFGGFLFFIPVWVFGIGVVVFNIINIFAGKK
jgi:hypothetical protein